MRQKPLKDIEAPRFTNDITEKEDPRRDKPITDKDDATRAIHRREIDDPS
jgi:hypothetical protein